MLALTEFSLVVVLQISFHLDGRHSAAPAARPCAAVISVSYGPDDSPWFYRQRPTVLMLVPDRYSNGATPAWQANFLGSLMVCISLRGRPCGGDQQLRRDHWPDAWYGDHQIEQFLQPSVGLDDGAARAVP